MFGYFSLVFFVSWLLWLGGLYHCKWLTERTSLRNELYYVDGGLSGPTHSLTRSAIDGFGCRRSQAGHTLQSPMVMTHRCRRSTAVGRRQPIIWVSSAYRWHAKRSRSIASSTPLPTPYTNWSTGPTELPLEPRYNYMQLLNMSTNGLILTATSLVAAWTVRFRSSDDRARCISFTVTRMSSDAA